MENKSCCACFKPKATLVCGICTESVCKNCAQFLDDDSFAFLKNRPAHLKHTTYCPQCFDKDVAEELARYNDDLDKAKDIAVFDISQGKETRNFKRFDEKYEVKECPDREETLLRLAFMAVRDGFNAIIDVDVTSKKVRQGSYQSQIYSGTAVAARLVSRR